MTLQGQAHQATQNHWPGRSRTCWESAHTQPSYTLPKPRQCEHRYMSTEKKQGTYPTLTLPYPDTTPPLAVPDKHTGMCMLHMRGMGCMHMPAGRRAACKAQHSCGGD